MRRIFIPDRFTDRLPESIVKRGSFDVESVGGYSLSGVHVELSDEEFDEVFQGDLEPAQLITTLDVGDTTSLLTPPVQALLLAEQHYDTESACHAGSVLAEQRNSGVLLRLMDVLGRFSEIVGMHVHMDVYKPRSICYPRSDTDRVHIVLGARAPGQVVTHSCVGVDDTLFNPQGKPEDMLCGAAGYGVEVHDSYREPVAQILGSTIYLFLPMEQRHMHLLGGQGTELFRMALQHAWERFIHLSALESESNVAESEDRYVQLFAVDVKQRRTTYERVLRKIDEEIADHRAAISRLIGFRRSLLKREVEETVKSTDVLAAEWGRLCSNPLIDTVECSQDGCLHVHTTDILVEDGDGQQRHLGRYIIRVKSDEEVSVWSKCSTHPSGVMHPHIGVSGNVCFGNVTFEIDELLLDGKDVEVIELVVAWLAEGYDPTLAEWKIEEWPLASEVDDSVVTKLDSVFVSRRDPYKEDDDE